MHRYRDRAEGGRRLAALLEVYSGREDVVALGLPRGGVPVAYEVAMALDIPLDVILVRKVGLPGQEELAMGAVASGGLLAVNEEVVRTLGIPATTVEKLAQDELAELAARERAYRGALAPRDLRRKVAILIDDGLATGTSMRVAARSVRRQDPARVVIAVPVAAAEACRDLRSEADEVVCAMTPDDFYAVGLWYEDFSQVSDDEVREMLERARARRLSTGATGA